MEKKNNGFLIGQTIIIILLIIVIIIMATGVFGKKDSAENSAKNETIEEKTTNEVETNALEDTNKSEDVSNNNGASIKVYSSEDNNYYLILTDYPTKMKTAKSDGKVHISKSFKFSINEYYGIRNFYGSYDVENNKIQFLISDGCTATNGEFNCLLPENASVIHRNDGANEMTLDYTDDTIMLGNVKLSLIK